MSEETTTETSSTETKSGIKTTEFWFSAFAALFSLAYASGLVTEGSIADKLIAIGAMVLTSLGYTVSRTITKKSS